MKKISTRICVIFVGIVLSVTIVISGSLIGIFSNIIRRQLVDAQQVLLEQNQVNVQNMLNSLNQVSVYLTTDNTIADILNDTSSDELTIYVNQQNLLQEFSRYVNGPLSDRLSTYSSTLYVYDCFEVTKDMESQPLGDQRLRLAAVYGTSAVKQEEWFQNTIANNGSFYTFVNPENEKMVYISRMIRNIYLETDDDIVGVMVVGLSREQFARQVEVSSLTPNAEIYIVDTETSNILYSSKENSDWEKIRTRLSVLENSQNGKEVEMDGETYLFMRYSTYWDWRIISLIPMSDIAAELQHVVTSAIVITILCLLVCIVIMYRMSQSISSPLVKLSDLMAEMKENDTVEAVVIPQVQREDEVGKLYQSFSRLMNRMRILLKQQYESGVKQKEAELLALQAQINPHFVYNVMDSINWLALCDGNDDMVEISSAFADIMRYSIKNPYEKVTLRDEVFHVENFMRIWQKQSHTLIHVIKNISSEHYDIRMPKFLIEPLVENCVIHGFAGSVEDAEIIITTIREDEDFIISIMDNGIGADVERLNQYIAGAITGLAHSDGFGIKNVNDRIHLMYSKTYGLSYAANPDGGITATIRIPYKE